MREQAGELAWTKLLEWAAAWGSLPWGQPPAAATAAALASAAAAVLQGEARRLPRLNLPRTAKGAAKWQHLLEAVASQAAFLAQPGIAGSSGAGSMTWRQLFLAVAPTGPRVARLAAALAGGHPPAAVLQEGGLAGALASSLAHWAAAVQRAGTVWRGADDTDPRSLRREAERAALELAASLVHLIGGLPALAAALGPLDGKRVLEALKGALAAPEAR